MGHSVVRTESGQNHFHSSEISPKRGTTFSRQRQFTSNKINELIHVRQRIVLKMGQSASGPVELPGESASSSGPETLILIHRPASDAAQKGVCSRRVVQESASETASAGGAKAGHRQCELLSLGFTFLLLGRQFFEVCIDDLGCVLELFLVRQKPLLQFGPFRITQIIDVQTFQNTSESHVSSPSLLSNTALIAIDEPVSIVERKVGVRSRRRGLWRTLSLSTNDQLSDPPFRIGGHPVEDCA